MGGGGERKGIRDEKGRGGQEKMKEGKKKRKGKTRLEFSSQNSFTYD